jgi:D-beta-D-heptose 7-phosphate kinase / D-beta-D-heptose 1-phosphate adenosyltransferase
MRLASLPLLINYHLRFSSNLSLNASYLVMNTNLFELIHSFTDLNIVVVGEAMLDSYLQGYTDRLCREAPVPVVTLSDRQDIPGGAANTAVNVRSLGGHPQFLSVIGDDSEGLVLQSALQERDISTAHLFMHPRRRTLVKHRVFAATQMLVRFDQGSTEQIDSETEQWLIKRLHQVFPTSNAVLISDYGYGILTPRVIQTLAALQKALPHVLVVDSRDLSAYRHVEATAVKPNYAEVIQLLDLSKLEGSNVRAEQIMSQQARLLETTGAQIAAVTLDTEGALFFQRGNPPYRTYAQPKPDSKAAGAGDTFISALTLALAANASTPAAAELASAAAAIAVAKEGTAACSANELQGYLSVSDHYVHHLSDLVAYVTFYRQQGQRIVFTNGCFDILHRGHIAYLNQAKALGDVLIVGVNSDRSIRQLKGPERPINPLDDRIQVLTALSCIDYMIAFDEDTPVQIIEAIRPDVYVKGGDYTRETLPEVPLVEALGGVVEILPYLPEHSTTIMIQRIRAINLCIPASS